MSKLLVADVTGHVTTTVAPTSPPPSVTPAPTPVTPAPPAVITPVSGTAHTESVFIVATFPNGASYAGSGVMVGPNDVLTAAHVVYDARYGGAATSVTVTPAYDPGAGTQAFGSYTTHSFHYLPDVDPNADGIFLSGNHGAGLGGSEADMALLDLSTAVGNQTGWMSMDPAFSAGTINMTGYPALGGFHESNVSGTVQRASVDSTLFYTNGLTATAGNSGGPLWYGDSLGVEHVVGVVSTSLWGADLDGAYTTLQQWISGNDYLIA